MLDVFILQKILEMEHIAANINFLLDFNAISMYKKILKTIVKTIMKTIMKTIIKTKMILITMNSKTVKLWSRMDY